MSGVHDTTIPHLRPTLKVGISGYSAGCRCSGCVTGYREYTRKWREAWRRRKGIKKRAELSPEQKKERRKAQRREWMRRYYHERGGKDVQKAYKSRPEVVALRREKLQDPKVKEVRKNKTAERRSEGGWEWKRRRKLDAIKLTSGCLDCGYNAHPHALDFDHVRGVKNFSISGSTYRKWEDTLAEVEKCDVVCANCHRIRTYERMQARKAKKEE